jgi:hypothetical protein
MPQYSTLLVCEPEPMDLIMSFIGLNPCFDMQAALPEIPKPGGVLCLPLLAGAHVHQSAQMILEFQRLS